MKKILGIVTLAFLTLIAAMMVSTKQSQSVTDLYVFGDSLSDTGVVFRASGGASPPNPPYFQGRYSNGRVWVEYLADRLQLKFNPLHNFACGGATTANDLTTLVPGLLSQVQSFIQTQPKPSSQALYVLWAGANDYLQGGSDPTPAVDNIRQAIVALAEAQVTKILVANLPDLGQLPATQNQANSAALSRLTDTHNQGLRRSLKQVSQRYPNLHVATLDANALYYEAIKQPSAFGFTNVVAACFMGSRPCGDPNQFLFWDSIHPTTAAHRHLGETAFAAIQEAGMGQGRSFLLR